MYLLKKVVVRKVRGIWVRGRLARKVRRCVRRADKMSAYRGETPRLFEKLLLMATTGERHGQHFFCAARRE